MLVVGFPAGPLQANCYLLAPAEGEGCVIVDPGQEVGEPLAERLRTHRLTPLAVLLTHGHFDHSYSAASICEEYGVPVWVHPDDRPMLADPLRGLGPDVAALLGGRLEMSEPAEVRDLADGATLEFGGLSIGVDHTPGHTGGSVCFHTGPPGGDGPDRLMLSGDTLFAGSIGRTDLPGGDHERMLTTLRTRVLTLPDETTVLPGHGPTTTIGRERAVNPFLRRGL